MKHKKWLITTGFFLIVLLGLAGWFIQDSHAAGGSYKILAWNDLGMHCYNRDFADLAVLPPYNNLWVQVVKVGDPPELVTSGVKVEYYYADNTYSVGKTNFWDYDLALFGVDLPANVGLKGKGLSGSMDLAGDHFVAEGIPITEYSDSAPTTRQPYQLATVVVKDATTGAVLTSSQVVTPTSSEMRCDNCHGDNGIARPSVPTGKVETNILKLHDENTGTTLMKTRPVLCASCHSSNALGAPGKPGIKSLSKSMHEQHASIIPSTLDGCYNCHPGPQTRCLRDVMSTGKGMTCVSCHGGMSTVSNNPNPWLNEPRCDTCHNTGQFNQDQVLYRISKGHGGLYCESCHDSTHAIAPSREANDAIKFNQLQGRNGPLEECSVCHANVPPSGGPHMAIPPHVNSVLRANPSPTSLPSVNYTVSFSENVTGVDKSDFHLTFTGLTNPSVSTVTGTGSTYTVTVNTGSGTGTISLDVVDDDSIKNASNTPLGGAGIGNGNYTLGELYNIVLGADTVGVFRPSNGVIYLKNNFNTGFADIALNYGVGGDYPVTGDWDGDGVDTIGVYRGNTFLLRNSNTVGFANLNFVFGQVGDQPIAGDWNNDGIDTIGVYRPSTGQFLLKNKNESGPADITFFLGNVGDVGIAGDWNGDGIDTTGVFRPSNGVIFLKNKNETGFAEVALNYGLAGDKPVVGDWDNNGTTTIGIYRGARFYLRNSNTNGFANITLDLGIPGDMPIAGNWDGKP